MLKSILDINKWKNSLVARNGFYISISHVATVILGLVNTMVIARYLGVELYGRLGYYTATISILSVFIELGVDLYYIVRISKDRANISKYFSMNVISRIIMTGVMTGVFYLVISASGKADGYIVPTILWVTFVMQNYIRVPRVCYQANEDMHFTAIYDVLDYVLLLIAALFLIVLGPKGMKLELMAIAYLVSRGLTLYFTGATAVKKYGLKLQKVDFREMLDFIKSGSPLLVNSIMTLIVSQVDIMMVNAFMGDIQTGYYNAVKKIVMNLLVFPGVFSAVLLPRMSNKTMKDENASIVLKINFVAGFAVLIAILLFSRVGILLLFGREFLPAYSILLIFGFGMPMSYASYYAGVYLVANELQKKVLFYNTLGAGVNIAANFILIPMYQASGAAYGSLISTFVVFAFSMYYYIKTSRENRERENYGH